MNAGIKVFAPATIANIAVGYDILGLALNSPGDEIIARETNKSKGVSIYKIHNDNGKLPTDPFKNTASVAGQAVLNHLGLTDIGIELEIIKKMPIGSGLGSSAASAVGGAFAVNELLKQPLTKSELLPFAVRGEQIADGSFHADNVAPSLLGGIILVKNNEQLLHQRLPSPSGLFITLIHPDIEILTKNAREIIKKTITLKDHIDQSFNLAGFISSLYQSDFSLMRSCLEDLIIEPQRAYLIPKFKEVKIAALNNNAIGCSISGAGPSIFALSENSNDAENIAFAMKEVFSNAKIDSTVIISKVNPEGSYKF
ncbi:homoserine kinase [Membranihabitans maritimus]|uniref:homoserine kinase n=1 Tax=Membranihabitans maritimus TaxID=2904244 RepID=UPI001F016BFC|nr:homoserine kinase [Membranihabitans maritimus]